LGGDVMPFLTNDFFTYQRDEDLGFIVRNQNIQIKSDFDILQDMGISFDTTYFEDNSIAEIKHAIANNQLVFVPIDRFHWYAENNQSYFRRNIGDITFC
jgi:hypothetical protein